MDILGIDLAWGDKKSDGLCLLEASLQGACVKAIDYTHGDDALMAWVQKHLGDGPGMILVDAPLVCPNATGIVRFFHLDQIVKYKKGRVADKRREFKRLQKFIRECLRSRFPLLTVDPVLDQLLEAVWNKEVEDRTDAFLCALIGYNHYLSQGRMSEVVGDRKTGFILLPV